MPDHEAGFRVIQGRTYPGCEKGLRLVLSFLWRSDSRTSSSHTATIRHFILGHLMRGTHCQAGDRGGCSGSFTQGLLKLVLSLAPLTAAEAYYSCCATDSGGREARRDRILMLLSVVTFSAPSSTIFNYQAPTTEHCAAIACRRCTASEYVRQEMLRHASLGLSRECIVRGQSIDGSPGSFLATLRWIHMPVW